MKQYIEVYFKDLSKEVQSQIKQWSYVDANFTDNIMPIFTLLPEDLENFIDMDDWDEEYDDEKDYSRFDDLRLDDLDDDFNEDYEYGLSYCDDDCETCKKVRCEERDFHSHDLDW